MANKTYIVELTSQERNQLKRLINTGKTAAYKQRHARILLLADRGSEGPALKDEDVANAVGTLGRQIVDGEKEVRIFGQKYPVKARVVQIQGFSAHADRDEIFQWLSGLKKPPRRIFVVHGEPESAQHFADFIRAKTGWDVTVPAYQEQFTLD